MNNMMQKLRSDERGNALFLILIAVVLFAALSYAITQSSRGSGNPNKETSLISGTTLLQYSSAVRTGVTRMLLRNATITTAGSPNSFTDPSATACPAAPADEARVFCPGGGGVSWQEVDQNTSTATDWQFFAVDITNVGTGSDDVVMLLTDVKEPVCQRIVDQIFGVGTTIPTAAQAEAAIATAGGALSGTDIDGQAFGCIEESGGTYIYYHALIEN
jgi:hypothetical protein